MSEVVIESLCDSLPRRVRRLGEIAYNLWWTWSPEAQYFTSLFSSGDERGALNFGVTWLTDL